MNYISLNIREFYSKHVVTMSLMCGRGVADVYIIHQYTVCTELVRGSAANGASQRGASALTTIPTSKLGLFPTRSFSHDVLFPRRRAWQGGAAATRDIITAASRLIRRKPGCCCCCCCCLRTTQHQTCSWRRWPTEPSVITVLWLKPMLSPLIFV